MVPKFLKVSIASWFLESINVSKITIKVSNLFAVNIFVSYSLIYVTCIMNVLKCNAMHIFLAECYCHKT